MSIFPPVDMIKGVINEAKGSPNIALSLLFAWAVLWSGGIYGFYDLVPSIRQNAHEISQVSAQVTDLKDDVRVLKDRVTDGNRAIKSVEIKLLEDSIFDARLKACDANSSDAKQFLNQRLQEMLREYETITGQRYRIPECSEIR